MNILSLDLGTKMGWALHSDDLGVKSGVVSFTNNRYEGGGMRYLRMGKWLNEIRETAGKIDAVYFEEVRRHAATDAAHVYGGFLAVVSSWCEKNAIPYQGTPVGTIKKFATGKGNADKTAMVKAAQELWPAILVADDNEADALCLLKYHL